MIDVTRWIPVAAFHNVDTDEVIVSIDGDPGYVHESMVKAMRLPPPRLLQAEGYGFLPVGQRMTIIFRQYEWTFRGEIVRVEGRMAELRELDE